jgi:hypothetical protein
MPRHGRVVRGATSSVRSDAGRDKGVARTISGMAIEPDTKDWTWVLSRPCAECGFDASTWARADVAGGIRANALEWAPVLARRDVASRGDPTRWSDLEYACHVRDVLRIFELRLSLMLEQVDPVFENWDQDATAIADDYLAQDPLHVAGELARAATVLSARYDGVLGEQWSRCGTRSNGSEFTVETLAIYGLHDPIHHLWDVTRID